MRQHPQEFWDFWNIAKVPYPFSFLKDKNLEAALNTFALREMLDYRTDGHAHSDAWICGFGVTLWMMGDRFGAANVWSHACDEALRGKFKYSSTVTYQAGLLL